MKFSKLNALQKKEATYLFADKDFATDPRAYEYELRDGQVTQRVRLEPIAQSRVAPRKVRVTVTRVYLPRTDASRQANETAASRLTRWIAEAMIAEEKEMVKA